MVLTEPSGVKYLGKFLYLMGLIMKYEVQTNTLCDGWVNTWTYLDSGSPIVFDTKEEAEKALADWLDDMNFECDNKNDRFDPSHFRVTKENV